LKSPYRRWRRPKKKGGGEKFLNKKAVFPKHGDDKPDHLGRGESPRGIGLLRARERKKKKKEGRPSLSRKRGGKKGREFQNFLVFFRRKKR